MLWVSATCFSTLCSKNGYAHTLLSGPNLIFVDGQGRGVSDLNSWQAVNYLQATQTAWRNITPM